MRKLRPRGSSVSSAAAGVWLLLSGRWAEEAAVPLPGLHVTPFCHLCISAWHLLTTELHVAGSDQRSLWVTTDCLGP